MKFSFPVLFQKIGAAIEACGLLKIEKGVAHQRIYPDAIRQNWQYMNIGRCQIHFGFHTAFYSVVCADEEYIVEIDSAHCIPGPGVGRFSLQRINVLVSVNDSWYRLLTIEYVEHTEHGYEINYRVSDVNFGTNPGMVARLIQAVELLKKFSFEEAELQEPS